MSKEKKTIGKSNSIFTLSGYILLGVITFSLILLGVISRYEVDNVEGNKNSSMNSNSIKFLKNKVGLSRSQSNEYEHVKKLFEETKILLRDISHTNITISKQTKEEMEILQSERKLVSQEIEHLQNEKNRMQSNFAECVIEKHKVMDELEKCEQSLRSIHSTTATIASANVPCLETATHSIGSLVDVEEDLFTDVNLTSFNQLDVNPRSYLADPTSTSSVKKWLVIGIPTISRPNNEDYLLTSLATMAAQLPIDPSSLLYHQVLIAVIHVEPSPSSSSWGAGTSTHTRFQEAKRIYATNPYFFFDELTSSEIYADPKVGSTPISDPGNANFPGYRVRKQSRNLAAVVKKVAHLGNYYLFLEDDMEFCSYGLLVIQYMIDKSSRYHPNWLAIRASYGMNGIVMKSDDAFIFAEYLLKHQVRRPPDHLVVEWYAGETEESKRHKGKRVNIGFKYNIFNHIGHVSTLRSARQTSFPVCYDALLEPTVFQVEAFNPRDCPRDDIWPCNIPHREPIYIHWDQVAIRH